MSDSSPFGFARFVPGFDFLQSLAQGAAANMPAMPALSEWVAPTLSVQEVDKRIQEFKTVQFWLEQNARALAATVQALEVQRMTLATLKDMNVAVGGMAAAMGAAAPGAGSKGADARAKVAQPEQAPSPQPEPAQQPKAQAKAQAKAQPTGTGTPAVDPMQWWTAVTQQFQQIAERAVQDVAPAQAAFEASREMAGNALKAASDMAAQWVPSAGAPAPKAAPPKPAAKKAGGAKAGARKADGGQGAG